ncbi:hypothetical protein C1I98_21990 [Spongiactinospora gelatinilytica]|uniref:Heparin-binding hemagglutinin n=1 Tax=Spongiactinospora gelatinilytica TaxID=2666298 RepID=A0A2W2HQF3_9ACTN|nr:hypothetical protein [Spongiactinospora gelatinilytica]PZG41014.1 hypothetical protein C1I98_21990 [Spongiactinospora gelatinilytica]
MTLATEVKKLTESKPFYAVAGAGDFAIQKLREIPGRLEKLQSRRGDLGQTAKDLPTKAREYAAKAEDYAKDLPVKAKGYADIVTVRATELYDEFADRGRKVVSRVSGEAALELEDVSEAAEPPIAKPAPRKTTPRKPAGTKRP